MQINLFVEILVPVSDSSEKELSLTPCLIPSVSLGIFLFSILQKLPERFLSPILMNWLDKYIISIHRIQTTNKHQIRIDLLSPIPRCLLFSITSSRHNESTYELFLPCPRIRLHSQLPLHCIFDTPTCVEY